MEIYYIESRGREGGGMDIPVLFRGDLLKSRHLGLKEALNRKLLIAFGDGGAVLKEM